MLRANLKKVLVLSIWMIITMMMQSFVIIQHNRFENTKKAYLSDDGKARMDTTDTAVVGCYFDAISSIEKGRVLPIKVIKRNEKTDRNHKEYL